MTTNALSSFGIKLQMNTGDSPEDYFDIAEIKDFSGPQFSLGTEETNTHDSASAWKTRVPTLLDGGEVSFDINFIPTNATHSISAGLLSSMIARTLETWRIVFPDTGTTSYQFQAYVTGFETDAPVEGVLGASVTLTISGAVTLVS